MSEKEASNLVRSLLSLSPHSAYIISGGKASTSAFIASNRLCSMKVTVMVPHLRIRNT